MRPFSVTEAMVAWLSSLGYSVSTRVPANAPDEFVTVERTGGSVDNLVDHAVLAVQAWAATEDRAEEMANAIKIEALFGERPLGVHSLRTDGPYVYYDEYTRCPRYQLVLYASAQLVLDSNN